MHGVAEHQPLLHAAFRHDLLDLPCDIEEIHPGRHVERQVFGVRLHGPRSPSPPSNPLGLRLASTPPYHNDVSRGAEGDQPAAVSDERSR